MSKQTVKNVTGVGRKIVKEITTIERATPSIIYFEGRLQGLESDMVDNFAIDATQDDRITSLEGVDIPTGLPAGSVIAWGGLTPPPGYLECGGGITTQAVHPQLYAVIGDQFNTGGEVGDQFRVPNLQGEFIRGWDNGRGVDPGRAFGSTQIEGIGDHDHFIANINEVQNTGLPNYADHLVWHGGNHGNNKEYSLTASNTDPTLLKTSYPTSGASETRPRNMALMYCIKAFDAITNQGMIDITALDNQVAQNTSDLAIFEDNSHTQNGYQKLPSGLIVQWGTVNLPLANGTEDMEWPIAFPNNVFMAMGNHTNADSSANLTGAMTLTHWNNLNPPATGSYTWFAIGS